MNNLDSPGISEEIIKEKINGADLIYVDGGNTFYLQRHIIGSSFWDAIDSHLKEGSSLLSVILYHIKHFFVFTSQNIIS